MAQKSKKQSRNVTTSFVLFRVGISLVVLGIAILLLTFSPLFYEEVKYVLPKSSEIKPIDTEFGIVIPKLGANAHIVPNVDPYNSKSYQYALTKGVAHARGTAVPGAYGNIFLFAHSSENFYNALRYNSVFYLLPKLVVGDTIRLYYNDSEYSYVVTGKKLVQPSDVSYLNGDETTKTLTLMTCWPPGTTIKRLLVFAELKK